MKFYELCVGVSFGDTEFDSLFGKDEVDVLSYKGGYQSIPFSKIKEV